VNVTTSTVLPDLRASVVPTAPPKKNPLKRKTPATTVIMVDKVNTTPHPDAIDLQDLVVDTPYTAKRGEKLSKQKAKQIKAPSAEQNAPRVEIMKEKAAKFAPRLTQPLASLPLTEQNVAHTAPTAETAAQAQMILMHRILTIICSSWSSWTDLSKICLMGKCHLCPFPLK
jgi:hypothetical protein